MLTEYESSPGKKRVFCRVCGSPVLSKRDAAPEVIRVRIGSLDSEISERPTAHIFTASNAGWYDITDTLPQHVERPRPKPATKNSPAPMRPDLASLALFIRVAETKSITKAAESSYIALAAASRRITQLETQFGVQLLHRTARGVELTPAGTALLARARQLMVNVDQMGAELADFARR